MVACTVLGAKLIAISALGSTTPIADQWDAEAAGLYAPYLKGTLTFADLVAPHNEHRILLHRLLSLMHLEIAGEWNTRLEMIFGAIVHTGSITWLTALLMPLVARRYRIILACFVAFLFAMPIGYENMLSGFQCQIYLMLLFGIAALAALATATPFSPRWFSGLAAAILSYFSFATGMATILAAVALVVVQLITNARTGGGREYASVAVMALVFLALFCWATSSARPLSTPWTILQGFALLGARVFIAGVPCAWFCRRVVVRRPPHTDRAWVAVAICAWVAIQLAMLAYGRGAAIAVRYFDLFLFIYPVAVVAIFEIAGAPRVAHFARFAVMSAVTWVFIVTVGSAGIGYMFVLGAIDWSRSAAQEFDNVQTYLATKNVHDLKRFGHGHTFDLTYPNPERQAGILDQADVRAILPIELRPVDANNAAARQNMLLKGKLARLTARTVHCVLTLGPGLLALGMALLFAEGSRASQLKGVKALREDGSLRT
ncbi:hypothetical protein A5725_21330 [Mycobacterium kubicae]|nr:hypothetical protein A5725_21330 [Mycobacterium kubicae]